MKKTRKVENTGKGIALQLLGFVLCFIAFPFGLIFGIMFLIAGSYASFVYRCPKCGNKVDKQAKLCPTCRAELD